MEVGRHQEPVPVQFRASLLASELTFLCPGVRAGRALNCRPQVLRACVTADGKPDCGFRKEHPQQVYPRHLYLHRPHERRQLWKVSVQV